MFFFARQIGDARSQVVRETCLVITSLVQNAHLKVANAAKQLFPSLFKLTYVTIKIISESAMKCLDSLVLALPVSSTINQLESSSQDVHAQARAKSAACLDLVLANTNKVEDLHPLLPVIEDLILRCLDDVSPEARAGSKASFARLQAIFPERAMAMASRMKESVRKLLGLVAQSEAGARGSEGEAGKAVTARLPQRTDFRAARLNFRTKAAAQAHEERGRVSSADKDGCEITCCGDKEEVKGA